MCDIQQVLLGHQETPELLAVLDTRVFLVVPSVQVAGESPAYVGQLDNVDYQELMVTDKQDHADQLDIPGIPDTLVTQALPVRSYTVRCLNTENVEIR